MDIMLLLLVPCAVSVCLLLATRIRDYLILVQARRQSETPDEGLPVRAPGISIVIPTSGQARALETHLPGFLAQNYPFFEVIVVMDDDPKSDTADVLKRLENTSTRLRHTFIPTTTRFVGHRKLAVTLGIKSARYEWVVVTQPDCTPAGPEWLMGLSEKMTDDRNLLIGYANYKANGGRGLATASYRRLRRALWAFGAAMRGRAVDADGCNMALRKSYFMQQGGYASQLSFTCGEDGLLFDRLATPGHTAVVCTPASTIWQDYDSAKDSRKVRIARSVADRHLRLRGKWLKWRWGLLDTLIYIYYFTWIAAAFLRASQLRAFPTTYNVEQAWRDVCLATLFFYPIVEAWALNRSAKAVGQRSFGLRNIGYDLFQVFDGWTLHLTAWLCRNDFRRK